MCVECTYDGFLPLYCQFVECITHLKGSLEDMMVGGKKNLLNWHELHVFGYFTAA